MQMSIRHEEAPELHVFYARWAPFQRLSVKQAEATVHESGMHKALRALH